MGQNGNEGKTTLRLSSADRKVIAEIRELSGLRRQSDIIRAALRTMLRRLKA